MKPHVTEAEYLQLIGLKALADQYNSKLKDIEAAVFALLAVKTDAGYVSDFVYDDKSPDWLLQGLGITRAGKGEHNE